MAQTDGEEIELDVLRAPVSPGSVLLGVAESDIQRPSDPTAFMVSLRQASDGKTQLPANYAIDMAPAWFFGKKNSASHMLGIGPDGSVESPGFWRSLWQSMVLSSAFKNPGPSDSLAASPQAGFGFKVSLCRGKVTAASASSLQHVRNALKTYTNALIQGSNTNEEQDAEWSALKAKELQAILERKRVDSLLTNPDLNERERAALEGQRNALTALRQTLAALIVGRSAQLSTHVEQAGFFKEQADSIKAAAEAFKIQRTGFFWDLSGGLVFDFRDRRLDNSWVTSWGVWTTLGNETTQGFAYQLLGRYLVSPDQNIRLGVDSLVVGEAQSVDGGIRFTLDPQEGKLAISLEALHRNVFHPEGVDPSWRMVFNAQYAFMSNRLLTFSFGRNFDGMVTKDGNLIAALNLLMGFGGKRKID